MAVGRTIHLLLLAAVLVGTATQTAPATDAPAPLHDLGEVWIGAEYPHTFALTSPADDRALGLRKVRSSCGCVRVDGYPDRIEPGTTGEIRTTLLTQGLDEGHFSAAGFAETDDPARQPTLEVPVRAVAEPWQRTRGE